MALVSVDRKTKETNISLKLDASGSGVYEINTGIGFFDHMLEIFSFHSEFDLNISAKGDLQVDYHHTVEDVGICLGRALRDSYGKGEGKERYGFQILPMDESLMSCSLDFSGRPYLSWNVIIGKDKIGAFDVELVEEFFRAVVFNSGLTAHFSLLDGSNAHHIVESAFKAFARALRVCFSEKKSDFNRGMIPSTKGTIGE